MDGRAVLYVSTVLGISSMRFSCPNCGCPFYDAVITRRPNGSARRTELFFCLGCTIVFLEPELLAATPQFQKTRSPELPTMEGDKAVLRHELSSRYWAARAKREHGGVPASIESVNLLRTQLGAAR